MTTPDLRLERTFAAPRGVIFHALTSCEHLSKWWGPAIFPIFTCTMDLRVGGVMHYGMRGADGFEMWGRWIFEEVTFPSRLQFLMSFSDAEGGLSRHPLSPTWPEFMRCVLVVTDTEGGSTLSVHAVPVEASEVEIQTFVENRDGMRAGFMGTFSQLDAYLETEAFERSRRSMSASRVYDAPVDLVFRVFTSPEHVTHWWGPEGFRTTTSEQHLAPGGLWRFTMHGPDGTDYLNRVEYVEVVPNERLVYHHGGEGAHAHIQFDVTVQFEALPDGKTRIKMTNTLASAEERDRMVRDVGAEIGLLQTLSRLSDHLATF